MNKVIREGKVAILHSPGYGAGWYSWNTDKPELLFMPELVEAVESGASFNALEAIVKAKYGDDAPYCGGLSTLTIEWLPVGTAFVIDEYDGAESVSVMGNVNWIIA